MQEPHELRPAPRPTPSAVLWLMAAVVVGGSGLLVFALPTQPAGVLASAARYAASPAAPRAPTTPASGATAAIPPALGTLRVP